MSKNMEALKWKSFLLAIAPNQYFSIIFTCVLGAGQGE